MPPTCSLRHSSSSLYRCVETICCWEADLVEASLFSPPPDCYPDCLELPDYIYFHPLDQHSVWLLLQFADLPQLGICPYFHPYSYLSDVDSPVLVICLESAVLGWPFVLPPWQLDGCSRRLMRVLEVEHLPQQQLDRQDRRAKMTAASILQKWPPYDRRGRG